MKKVIIIFTLIVIAIIGVVVIKNNKEKKYNYKIETISEYKYYIYKENNQYGVIDENGNVIIEAKYNNVIIPNPSRDIFVCYVDEKADILNSNKEKLFTKYDSVEPIKLKNVASTLAYEKSVFIYKQNEKFGLINFEGKVLTKSIYDTIENLQPTEGKFLVSQNKKYGIIDLKGNTILKTEYDICNSDGYYTSKDEYAKSGYIVGNKTNEGYRYGYFNYTGKKILDLKYNDIERVLNEDSKNLYLIVALDGKYGLYNKSKKIINNDYQEIIYDDNVDLLLLQKNKKFGVAKLDGKVLIDTNCDEIESKGIYLYVKSSNNNKVYDNSGNIVDMNFNLSIYKTENEDYRISTILNNNITYYGIMDKNGNQLVENKYRYLEYLFQNYFIAVDDQGNLGVINSNGKTVVEMKYNSLQKVKGKNIVQAINDEKVTEIYSKELKNVLTMQDANISIQEDYIIVSNQDKIMYLDNDGNIINDTAKLKKENYPKKIGDFEKEQTTIENIYYVKK